MNYYNEIKQQIINNEIYGKIKDYSKEKNRVITYFNIGKLLYKAGKEYGENIIGQYSERLMNEVGKKYNKSTLFRMKQFYTVFSNEKVAPLAQQLSWSHYVELLSLKNENKILYYINQCIELNLSRNELRKRIKNNEYERIDDNTKLKLVNREDTKVYDLVKNPIIINNKNKYEIISEKMLKKLILEDLEHFLEELGNQFCFIKSEYKIKIGSTYNYIDLLLYNI